MTMVQDWIYLDEGAWLPRRVRVFEFPSPPELPPKPSSNHIDRLETFAALVTQSIELVALIAPQKSAFLRRIAIQYYHAIILPS